MTSASTATIRRNCASSNPSPALYPEARRSGRDPRRRQQRRRATVDSRRNPGATGPRRARVWVAKYNDFNTFYLQAASGTAPVGIDPVSPFWVSKNVHPRRVVALNAAARAARRRASTWPLGRVRRALDLIQQGKTGCARHAVHGLQLHAYDELERLGWTPYRGCGTQEFSAQHRHAGGHRSAARFDQRERAATRRHTCAPERALRHAVRTTPRTC